MLILKIFNDILKFQSLSMEGTAVNATLDHPEPVDEQDPRLKQEQAENIRHWLPEVSIAYIGELTV
jgi:hypothetical protein